MLVKKSRKGVEGGMWATVGAIAVVGIIVLIILFGVPPIFAKIFGTADSVSSCEGMGFAEGECVPPGYLGCDIKVKGLGCEKNDVNTHCCFKSTEGNTMDECIADSKCKVSNLPCKCLNSDGKYEICSEDGESYCQKDGDGCRATEC